MTTRPLPRPYEKWRTNEADRGEDAANIFGHYLMLHCREEALSNLPPEADPEARTVIEAAVDSALHNMVSLLEGYWRLDAGGDCTAELALHVNIRRGDSIIESVPISPSLVDLPIGYWSWRDPSV